jgi:hypothetical protein
LNPRAALVSIVLLKAEYHRSTDPLVVGMASSKADHFVTSGNAVHRFEEIRYLNKSEISLRKNSPYK